MDANCVVDRFVALLLAMTGLGVTGDCNRRPGRGGAALRRPREEPEGRRGDPRRATAAQRPLNRHASLAMTTVCGARLCRGGRGDVARGIAWARAATRRSRGRNSSPAAPGSLRSARDDGRAGGRRSPDMGGLGSVLGTNIERTGEASKELSRAKAVSKARGVARPEAVGRGRGTPAFGGANPPPGSWVAASRPVLSRKGRGGSPTADCRLPASALGRQAAYGPTGRTSRPKSPLMISAADR